MNIKYISPEKSLKYITKQEDIFNSPIKYFTLIPSQDPEYSSSEGWEDVIYITNKLKDHRMEKGPDYQYVYIFTNKAMPGLIKIGYTDKEPEKRAVGVSRATGVPVIFEVVYSFPCFNGVRLEKEVHNELDNYRLNNDREFFTISVEEAIKVIEKLGQKYQFL